MKGTILTGDRPTGPLHLGHYVGSLQNRIRLQDEYEQFIILADAQGLTDNFETPEKLGVNIFEVLLDYLAVGIDPNKSTIFIQSQIPELAELFQYFLNIVTLGRLQQNPTVKLEMREKNFSNSIPMGFLSYPVSQAADILAFKANLVPVGEDQCPMIEQTNDIVSKFNQIYRKEIFKKVEPLLSHTPRLSGIDGKNKMSKSLGNAIYLSDSYAELSKKVKAMYTDPHHLKVEDPGHLEGNTVFEFISAFGHDLEHVEKLKQHYITGGLGDGVVKRYLLEILEDFLAPVRKRREDFSKDRGELVRILKKGNTLARAKAASTLDEVKRAMSINYF